MYPNLGFAYVRKDFAGFFIHVALQLWCIQVCVLLMYARLFEHMSPLLVYLVGSENVVFAYVRKVFALLLFHYLPILRGPKWCFSFCTQGFC